MKRGIAVICLFFAAYVARADDVADSLAKVAKSTTWGTDITGLWYVPTESGWGANIIQQGPTLFVTLFVYGPDNRPLWLVGSNTSYTNTDSSGALVWSGPLYQTTGPWFGGSFNPAAVGVTQVGTITVRGSQTSSLQITYSVNGVTVNKTVVSQNWQSNNLTGTYVGAISGATANCVLPLPQATGNLLRFTVNHTGSNATITAVDISGNQCLLSGSVSQQGKLSTVVGTYVCTNGSSGSFGIGQMEAGFWGITGFYVQTNNNCSNTAASLGAARVF